MAEVILSIFVDEKITEEELERFKSQDMLESILNDISKKYPKIKTPLFDERDQYLAQKIKEAPGIKIVAILGAAHVADQTLNWILWTSSLAALDALLAFGHPLTILTAFVVAPITTLNLLIAAGWFAGLTQVYFRRPSVKDFVNLSQDIFSFKGLE